MNINRRSVLATFAFSLSAVPFPALAQTYPTRPVHLIVPYPPGGPTDVVARILANSLGPSSARLLWSTTGRAARPEP